MNEHLEGRLRALLRKRDNWEAQLLEHDKAGREGRCEVARDEIKSLNAQINALHEVITKEDENG